MAATTTTNRYLLTAATTDAHHLQMTADALYHNNQDHHHHHINDNHHHYLELTAANNLDVDQDHYHHNHHHQHQHNQRLDERSSSVTSDQFSSLNLSSVGSSAHHSPILEHETGRNEQHKKSHHHIDEGAFNRLTIATALDTKANKGPGAAGQDTDTNGAGSLTSTSSALSDYHGSIPCSPVESSIGSPPKSAADDLLMLASPSVQPHATLALSDHVSLRFEERDTRPRPSSTITESTTNIININSNNNNINNNTTTTNNNNNSHLHPDAHQEQQHHQKARSYSHSTAFSPLVKSASPKSKAPTPTRDSKLVLLSSENHEPNRDSPQELLQLVHQQQQPIIERPRRLSRIENRQSLHDLGYGCIESYFKLQRLGKGTYATVYMGRSKLNNDLVALKEILKEHDEGAPCTAIREVSLLRLLRHNNIVTLHDICHTPKKLTLVFEYVGPDLYAYMKENNHLLSIHNVRLLLYQLLRGIAFCHSRQVLHRDLKPQNLLINSRGELKICDFGLARAKSIPTKSYSNEVVTLWYRPPDVLLGNTDYDHSIDMWGVGCIFYEMASGRTFFPGSSVRQQLYLIFSSLGAPSQSNWPEILTNPDYLSYSFPSFRPEKLAHRVPRLDSDGVQLLQSFLRFKPSERISADEARRDPFFACLPERVHHLNERESIFDVPGVYMTLNPGQKLNHLHHHHHHHHHHPHHH